MPVFLGYTGIKVVKTMRFTVSRISLARPMGIMAAIMLLPIIFTSSIPQMSGFARAEDMETVLYTDR